MAAPPAADPKTAPLTDDLREFALALDVVPKNFSCAICNKVAVDAYKLLCCNKPICSSCREGLEFGDTQHCPLCDHEPMQDDTCPVHRTLRNTIRIWLPKQQKKLEEKLALDAATPIVESTPTVETTPVVEATPAVQNTIEAAETVGTAGQAAEGETGPSQADKAGDEDADVSMLTTNTSTEALNGTATAGAGLERDASSTPQPGDDSQDQGDQDATADDAQYAQGMDGQGNAMMGNNPNMYQHGMPGQFGNLGAGQNQAGFNHGMPFNGMNPMNGMSNVMGNAMYMNPMGYGMNTLNNMYGSYGGNMGMGMNSMGPMNYGGGYGNGWNDMGGAGGYGGFNNMGGNNQSGAFPGMTNQYPNKNNFQNQNRYNANGGFAQQRPNRNGSFGYAPGNGYNANNSNSRPESGNGPRNNNRDGQSPARSTDAPVAVKAEDEHVNASAEAATEGKEGTEEAVDLETAEGENAPGAGDLMETAGTESNDSNVLNPIQTVPVDDYPQSFHNSVQAEMDYASGMMGQYRQPPQFVDANPYGQNFSSNSFGYRGDHNAAYGSSTVLVGEPKGLGVAGAPTGPRAMREKTNFRGPSNARFGGPPPRTPIQTAASVVPERRGRSQSPIRDDSLRTKERSPSRSRSRPPARDKAQDGKSRSAEHADGHNDGAQTPLIEDGYDRDEQRRHHRPSRYGDERDDHDDRHRDEQTSRGNRTRSATPESKHRSRRDEKHRSSRSQRDRSREYRRRHRSYSRSPIAEDKYENDTEEPNPRRKTKSDKDKYRDRSRDKDRDRDRRDRKERDYDDDKYRSRDKDRERRRRRDREVDEDRGYDEDKHRSRRSRKDRDRERDYDRDYDKEPKSATSARPISPPLNAPAGPSADRFSFRGASTKAKNMPPPPTGPRGLRAPKGPSADREKRGRTNSVSSAPSTPTKPSVQDHYAAERERNARERAGLTGTSSDQRDSHQSNKHSSLSDSKTLQSRISSSSSRPSKRSLEDNDSATDGRNDAPTGPASSPHRDKRRKSRDGNGNGGQLANLFTKGLRKSAGKRGGVKTEGEVERGLEKTERERDGRRW